MSIITRLFLGLTLILAVAVVGWSINVTSVTNDAWATLAAALAVVTSVVSAWGAQRVVELEEDRLQPCPYPYFDTSSRYGLMLLRVVNSGASVAYDIDLHWDSPLINSKGMEIKFPQKDSSQIPVLGASQSISILVDGHINFFKMEKMHKYSGKISFKDGRGKIRQYRFVLDGEMHRGTLTYDTEELKTQFEVQRIPDALNRLERELSKIRLVLDSKNEDKKPAPD